MLRAASLSSSVNHGSLSRIPAWGDPCPQCSTVLSSPTCWESTHKPRPQGRGTHQPLALLGMHVTLLIYFTCLGTAWDDLGLVLLCVFGDRPNTWANYLNDCSSIEGKTKLTSILLSNSSSPKRGLIFKGNFFLYLCSNTKRLALLGICGRGDAFLPRQLDTNQWDSSRRGSFIYFFILK